MPRTQRTAPGLRQQKRVTIYLLPTEYSALHWLQRFAREDQLPADLHPFRKMPMHRAIKSMSSEQLALLQENFAAITAADPAARKTG